MGSPPPFSTALLLLVGPTWARCSLGPSDPASVLLSAGRCPWGTWSSGLQMQWAKGRPSGEKGGKRRSCRNFSRRSPPALWGSLALAVGFYTRGLSTCLQTLLSMDPRDIISSLPLQALG